MVERSEHRLEHHWLTAFEEVFRLCNIQPNDEVAILSESQSRKSLTMLSELALLNLGAKAFHIQIPTSHSLASTSLPVRSTGASQAIQGIASVMAALTSCPMIIDCTVEGLMHAPELPQILKSGARVLNISNEHPEALARLVPNEALKTQTLAASRLARNAQEMTVTSKAGTDLKISMEGAATVGIWGYTDKPGTLAHWPGGLVVSFPKAKSVNGTLVLDKGDANLTFKRYLQDKIHLAIKDDFITDIQGEGADYKMMTGYLEAWDDPLAYAVSHVGWGLNKNARYEALSFYDKQDTNGTELRAFAGNFLFSTGANEFANRFTEGHFDIPVTNCTISLDGVLVVKDGKLV